MHARVDEVHVTEGKNKAKMKKKDEEAVEAQEED